MTKIRIKSDGNQVNTEAFLVLEDGTEEELPWVSRIEWVADVHSDLCTATVTFLKAEVEVDGGLESQCKEVQSAMEVLEEIAHHPSYDGKFCQDPDDCPNCIARAAVNRIKESK